MATPSLDKALLEEPKVNEESPVMHFQYTYPHGFLTIAQAFVRKYNYEPRVHLTTVSGAEQLDEDRFMFYRRVETVFTEQISYERVIIDRREGGQITSELLKSRPGQQERLFERGTIKAEGENASIHNHLVFQHQGIKTLKVEFFKSGVEKVLKAIKFAQYEQEQ